MFGMPNGAEWFIVLLLLLIVFGAPKLPETSREVRRAIADMRERESVAGNARPDLGFDLIMAVTLVVAGVACATILAMAQAGWV